MPHSYGDATVSMYLGGRLCDTMTVHVVKPGEEPAKTTVSITDGYSTSMDKGTTQQLKAKVSPDDKASKVVWSSSNENVLTVDGNGLVIAVGDGNATITATVDGVSATTDTITVTTPVVRISSVSLSASNLKLAVGGEPSTLTATVEPNNATNKNVSWSSSDPEVATVADGVVTPVKAGAATITVTTEDGEYSATCKVTVIQPATGITLDKQKVTLVGAATEQLKATVVPAEADQTVVWKSSNDSVATVDQTGKVTSVSKGAATITASTEDGTYSQDCAVTVSNPATNLTVDQTALNLKKGEERTVKISLVGALAGEVDETKLALDNTGASKAFEVVDNGDGSYTVTALKTGSGSFVITAESLSQTVSVTVTNPVQKVELDKTSLSFTVGDASVKLSATVSPVDADDTTVSWASSDSSIATVKDGVVTPLKAGTATITATCGDKTTTCTVTVAARTIAGVAGSDGTDVSVSAENNAAAGIAQNNSISLVVEEPTNLTDAANATISGLEQGSTKVADKLDIKLLKDGEVIEDYEGMSFIVRVKMTAAMKALTNLKVLYVAEDGSTQAMDTWIEGDYLCFRTSHFSTYVVTGEEANGEPAQPTQPVTPSQPGQQTTTRVTKKSTKTTKGALANTGDQAPAVAFIMAVAGASLIAFALMRKRLER
ncbi:Ig-like domain-containing protein [Collinsella sp. TF10-11AT]|uniref:Ig-like domain-containing protein n=2 Tax=Collinsella TaxID=102106 RepID=UPI001314BEA7|nr:Ig-like domain-containing protein [Collinsella sp. TF10-11AT]